jgi:hypothetical protein
LTRALRLPQARLTSSPVQANARTSCEIGSQVSTPYQGHEIGERKQVGVGVAAGAGVTTTHSIWPGKAPQRTSGFY